MLYHTTGSADLILRDGFHDGRVSLPRNGALVTGVWLADRPMTAADFSLGGGDVLTVDIPESVAAPFEQPDDGLLPEGMEPYRAFLIPSAVVNRYAWAALSARSSLRLT